MAGIFGSIVRARPSAAVSDITLEEFARLIGGGADTSSGIVVSPESAMRYTTCLICLRVLGEAIASFPLILYRRRKDGGKDRATDHPLYRVLHDQANAWNTAFEYTEGTMVNLASRGNGYAYIDRGSKGQILGLIPLNPDGVTIDQSRDWSPNYTATLPDNTRTKLSASQIHHIRGPLPKGYVGRSMVALAREGIGLGLAGEKFLGKLIENGVNASGFLKHPKGLGDAALKRLRDQLKERKQGTENAGAPLILEEGMDWTALSINPVDAQFLEQRKMQRAEISGVFRVPLHLVNDLDRATFSNIEHQSLAFVVYSLMPWLKRWEQAISRDLLLPSERETYFAEFLVDGLLRGDFKARMEGYAQAIQNGILNPNETRIKENMNPREGGDEYWKPSNMMGDAASANAIVNALMPGPRAALAKKLREMIDQDAIDQESQAK